MCGIFSIINHNPDVNDEQFIKNSFQKGQARGPEFSTIKYYENYNSVIGFHRLAINGLNVVSNQPIIVGDVTLICNGEIYNYKQLYKMMNITPTTQSDCEVIIYLFLRYGIDHTLRMLDGVFAFVLYTPTKIFVARDPYGVRPMYYIQYSEQCYDDLAYPCIIASEMKMLNDFAKRDNAQIIHFSPGYYGVIGILGGVNYGKQYICKYHNYASSIRTLAYKQHEYENKLDTIYDTLKLAVFKRCETTERPIACLLSGGLDSSLVASLVSLFMNENNLPPVETYSIGLPDSEDIKYARIVADYIGSKHTEIIVSEDDMIHAIPEVINAIESYDTTTVRASIGNYLIGKYIKANSLAKVIFNGDGSDELCGGYIYMNKCPDDVEFDKETIRLLSDIHMFDVLRSDKSISSHGLEPRTPFLDKHFVDTYLSIPVQHRRHPTIEKFMLREAFSGRHLLPDEIIWRKKEAFSDGVSKHGRSLYQIIQESVKNYYQCEGINTDNISLIDLEKDYYLRIFNLYYLNQLSVVPYYWMPKYTNATDPSARTLEHYVVQI
jgi:asparagine synthase (glutamine-hydrolysing)